MQRSVLKEEEKKKKKVDEEPRNRCKQVKLNEEAVNTRETDASPTSSNQLWRKRVSFSEPRIEPSRETSGDWNRKQSDEVSKEQNHPSKYPRSSDKPSPSNKKGGDGLEKPKSLKAVWSVLKPPKPQTNKGSN